MKAVVYQGPNRVSVDNVEDARIDEPTDAVLRLTSTALCRSDLHMYEGRTTAEPGLVFGHEPIGVIEEVGSAVRTIRRGDRVALPFNISCGFCFNCTRGFSNACTTCNPGSAGAAYGYVNMRPHRGAQAEFVRVPYVDVNALKLPGEPGDELEEHFAMLADVFPTGYHAAVMAMVEPGDSVAVWGAGPVGLMSAYSCLLRGAAEVYVVDRHEERLRLAESIGAIPIDFSQGDPVEQIRGRRGSDPAITGRLRPGEDKMLGVMAGIDAVGFQANDETDPSHEHATQAIDDLAELVNATGRINLIGVYLPADPGAGDPHAREGVYETPVGKIWSKGITVSRGQANVRQHQWRLRDLIASGRARPGFVVTQQLGLAEAPTAYEQFDQRAAGFTKVLFKPGRAA